MFYIDSFKIYTSVALLTSALLIAGCSSDSQSVGSSGLVNNANDTIVVGQSSDEASTDDDNTDVAGNDTDEESSNPTTPNTSGNTSTDNPADNPVGESFTRVTFDITVPVYQSDELKIGLVSNDKTLTAGWVLDESWAITDDFLANTEHPLVITFYDRNGAMVLGQVETQFVTGSNASESILISASQFNTAQWDDDNDGVSNLNELIAGGNPLGADLPNPVQNELAVLPIKTLRISWQPTSGAEFYRVLENADGVSGFQQIGDDLAASVQSYDHTVALYARTNAAYMVQACDAFMCSDSEAQTVDGFLTNAIGYFKAITTSFNSFGTAVVLSADGQTLIVGSPDDGSLTTGINGDPTAPNPTSAGQSGAVYVFVRTASGWTQQAYIKASDSVRSTYFGRVLSLSDDGNTMAVYASKAYLFERTNGQWEETTILEASGAISLSGDGNTFVARNREDGSVSVFERGDGTWPKNTDLTGGFDDFGQSLSLNRDGTKLAVRAGRELNSSDVRDYVMMFDRSSGIWQDAATLNASNPDANDGFGRAISLSSDGNTLVVGAIGEDSFATGINGYEFDNTSGNSGAAYVFVDNNGSWVQEAYLKASNPDASDNFGSAVSISANGDTLVIGAENERSSAAGVNGDETDNSRERPGAAYVFVRSNGVWQQQAYLKASNTNEFAWFGDSVSISGDGHSIAVGARYEAGGTTGIGGDATISGSRNGAAYLY